MKQAAALYDRYHPSSVQLSAFEGQYMEPYIFKDQLRRCFGLRLSPQEFGALLHYFEDKERGGVVDCVEFLVTFFRTGKQTHQHPVCQADPHQTLLLTSACFVTLVLQASRRRPSSGSTGGTASCGSRRRAWRRSARGRRRPTPRTHSRSSDQQEMAPRLTGSLTRLVSSLLLPSCAT